MIIAFLSKIPSLQEVLIWEENFFSLHLSPFLVIAFRKDVIIQVLIGALAPTPFEAAQRSLLFFYLIYSNYIDIINYIENYRYSENCFYKHYGFHENGKGGNYERL